MEGRSYATHRSLLGPLSCLLAAVGLVAVSLITVRWSAGAPLPWAGWIGAVCILFALYHLAAIILRRPRIEIDQGELRIIAPHSTHVVPLPQVERLSHITYSQDQVRHATLGVDWQSSRADWLEIVHRAGRIILRADQFAEPSAFDVLLQDLQDHSGHTVTLHSARGSHGNI